MYIIFKRRGYELWCGPTCEDETWKVSAKGFFGGRGRRENSGDEAGICQMSYLIHTQESAELHINEPILCYWATLGGLLHFSKSHGLQDCCIVSQTAILLSHHHTAYRKFTECRGVRFPEASPCPSFLLAARCRANLWKHLPFFPVTSFELTHFKCIFICICLKCLKCSLAINFKALCKSLTRSMMAQNLKSPKPPFYLPEPLSPRELTGLELVGVHQWPRETLHLGNSPWSFDVIDTDF